MTTQKIKETYCFIYKEIKIYVRIDYLNNKIDILEPVSLQDAKFKKKEWCFIGRGVEYMQGWRNILEAISEATKDAQKKYETDLAENSAFKEEQIINLLSEENKQQRYTIIKIKNGLWRLEWENGEYSEHSTQDGAKKMSLKVLRLKN